jgi:hypothetical protein
VWLHAERIIISVQLEKKSTLIKEAITSSTRKRGLDQDSNKEKHQPLTGHYLTKIVVRKPRVQ